ncbi:MAG: peptide chain release factor-like protein [Phycisphaerae bacterium]|nr:peptide chain release factor-like protein [Phycisphaerae bacterium]
MMNDIGSISLGECADSQAARYLALGDSDLLAQCQVDTYRARGPGGQKRNKTASAVRLRHLVSGLSAIGVESRSQHENKARALRRLRKTIALSLRVAVDPQSHRLSNLLKSCICGSHQLCVGQKDYRYYHAISEILDVLAGCGVQISTTAELLGVSTANLVSFLRNDPALWGQINRMRTAVDLKPLR